VAELAVTDGIPPPDNLPRGECIMTRLDDGSLRIDHADPRILISAELLARACVAPGSGISLGREHPGSHCCGEGALLKINGVNRQVIYRITEYVPRVHGYVAEWPD
jgi:hypothetical protein